MTLILFWITNMHAYNLASSINCTFFSFLLKPHNLLKALLNSLFCLCLLLFPYPLLLPQFLLFHKHIALMGPVGLWGYVISSHINNPTAIHNMHAFFLLSVSLLCIFLLPETEHRLLGSDQWEPTFSRFCGNHNIVFHETVPSSPGNSLQAIWSGLLFWSKPAQSESRESGFKLHFWMLCWQSKISGAKLNPWPRVRVCIFERVLQYGCGCDSYMEMLLNGLRVVSAGPYAFCDHRCALATLWKVAQNHEWCMLCSEVRIERIPARPVFIFCQVLSRHDVMQLHYRTFYKLTYTHT